MNDAPKDNIVRHSVLLLVTSNGANVMNVLFQALMGWSLPKTEFREMLSMMSLMLLIITPLDAVRTSVAHMSAVGMQAGRPWVARELAAQWSARFFAIAAVAVAAGFALSPWIAAYENVSSVWPVRIVSLVCGVMLFAPFLVGIFQGTQFFLWMSAATGIWTIIRLIAGYVIVRIFLPTATGALTAHLIGLAGGLAASAWGLRSLPRNSDGAAPQRHTLFGGYFSQSFLTLAAYGLLTYADLLLVSHFFPAADADRFAQAALIGRSVIFLPVPIAYAMFPKVVSVGASSRRTLATLLKALAMVAAIIGAAVFVCTFLTWIPIRLLFGIKAPTAEQLHLARTVLWAMSPLTLTYMLVNVEMAQHRFRALPFLWLFVAAYIGAVALIHDTLAHFILILATVSTASAICLTTLVIRAHTRD